ncbi:MAG TPA: hypothetical protein VGC87_07430 [Pyrinomonadaceae bacterium]|jgi:uncharacterized delta-60 repeat protein
MISASPHRARAAACVTCAVALSLFINLLPSQGLAAAFPPAPPHANKPSASSHEQTAREAGARAPQETSSTAGRQSPRARSPLAESPVLQEFRQWVEQYDVGGLVAASEEKGVELSTRRRSVMAKLIEEDPESALELAMPARLRQKLPPQIQHQVEEQVSGYGDFIVAVYDHIAPQTGEFTDGLVERTVVLDGKTYRASVYGRKAWMTTKLNLPLRGVRAGDVIALAESPVRVLGPEERDPAGGVEGIEAEVGGRVERFESEEQLAKFEEKLKGRELSIGPGVAEGGEASPESSASSEASVTGGVTPQSPWTEGAKTVLFMRVDFSDAAGEPVDVGGNTLTVARAQALVNTECNNFYKNNSYNKTSVTTTVTPVLRMPQTAAWYGTGNNIYQLLTDARAAAKSKGFDTANFTLDVAAFRYISTLWWAGYAWIGAKGAWLNGYFDLRVTAHELGHNYGLYHANFWHTTDGTVTGTGSSEEYGNPFDQMGIGDSTGNRHFSAWDKNTLGWVPDADVQNVTTGGTYRIQAYDSITAAGRRALKIQKDASTYYWVEFRQAIAGSPYASNGATIYWGYTANTASNLLDMTPTSGFGADDAPLAVGQIFTDSKNGIKITAVAKTATAPAALDVSVTFTTNLNTLALATSPVAGGGKVTGTVTLNAPAPAIGAVVTLSDDLAATTLPASVTIPAGATRQTFSITTTAVTVSQTGTVTASYRGVNKTAPLTVQPVSLASITLAQPSVGGGGAVGGTVTLTGPAPAAGAVVTLADNLASTTVPASVTIPAGVKSKTFSITTVRVAVAQVGSVTASYGGVAKSAPLTVAPLAISSLTINPASIVGGNAVTGTVMLNGPAPAGGAVVTLSDSIPAATTPSNVTVPAGAKTKTFSVTTVPVTINQGGNVTASYGGATKSAALVVQALALSSVTLSPASVAGGVGVAGTVTLNGPATSAGVVVTLSDNLAATTVPSNVTVPAGATSKTFNITTTVVAATQSGTVTAKFGAVSKTAALTVRPPALSALTLNPASVSGGNSVTGTVSLDGPAPAAGALVSLSDTLAAASAPASVTIPGGATSKDFTITTSLVTAAQQGSVAAAYAGVNKSAALTVGTTGSLDPSFNRTGAVTTDFKNSSPDAPNAVAIQADGKIVVVGGAPYQSAQLITGSFEVARYNPDGSLDATFGTGGKVITDLSGTRSGTSPTFSIANSVAIQRDGKIVVGGYTYDVSRTFHDRFAVVRYNKNGTLDTSFDADGVAITGFLTPRPDAFYAVDAYLSSVVIETVVVSTPGGGKELVDKIVAGGWVDTDYSSRGRDFGLVRYNPDGSLDFSFDGDGRVLTPFPGDGDDRLTSLRIQPDGKILAGGYSGGVTYKFALARYNEDGSPDLGLGGSGLVLTDFQRAGVEEGTDAIRCIAVQPDGKIIAIGGTKPPSADDDLAMARYNAGGALDATFGTGGKVISTALKNAYGVALQADGKFIVVGGLYNFAVARFNPNGTPDTTFGTGGFVNTVISAYTNQARAVAIQPDGNIVVAGRATNSPDGYPWYGTVYDFAVARYLK